MDHWPQYACAMIVDDEGRLLLEKRPEGARLAAGRLTCFGGRREPGETPEQCLRRELREELAWEPRELRRRVELWVASELIAWFYEGRLDIPFSQLHVHSGHEAVLVACDELPGMPLSPWHQAVLEAWRRDGTSVTLET